MNYDRPYTIQRNDLDVQNTLLFPRDPQGSLRKPIPTEPTCLHFQAQAMDKMFNVERQRRVTLDRDVGIQSGRLHDPYHFDTGEGAVSECELIDDSDTKSGLDERADCRAEPCADGDIVVELLAGKDFSHHPPIGICRVNANQWAADDFRRGKFLATRKLMPNRHNAKQLPRRERQEVEAGVIETIAHCNALTSAEQNKIDGLLDLGDVDIDRQVGVTPPHPLDGTGAP